MLSLAARNMKLYFRDRSAVFFSFLSVMIIIMLYALFLENSAAENLKGIQGAHLLIKDWMTAGILAVGSVTTPLGALGSMVDDRADGISRDFFASPVARWKIAGGYILSAFLVGVILCTATFAVAEGLLAAAGGSLPTGAELVRIAGILLVSALTGSTMAFFLATFLKSSGAYGAASTVVGTLIGFLTGVYVPIGDLPGSVQTVIRLFPTSHAAALFRQILMEKQSALSFTGPYVSAAAPFRDYMGVVFVWNGQTVPMWQSIAFLMLGAALFFGLSVLNLARQGKS
jgi:multidrug/hemolysin transport system permease protein